MNLLRKGETLALWAGQLTSVMGDRLYAMAVLWLVLELTGSTQLMAAVALAQTVPLVLVGLVGGGLIDYWNKFQAMVVIDLVRALLVGLIALDYFAGTLVPWHFLVVGLGLGALEALFSPSLQSSLPAVVDRQDLQAVIGLMDLTSRLAQILGPGSAGIVLLFVSEAQFFNIDAASFILSALSLAWVGSRLRRRGVSVSGSTRRPGLREWGAGFEAVRADRPIALGISLRVVCNAANTGFTLGAPLLVASRFGEGIGAYGLILAAYGAGSLGGNVLAGNLRFGALTLFIFAGSWGAMGLGLIVVALAPAFWVALLASTWMGAFGSMQHVSMEVSIAHRMRSEVLGRVYSLQRVGMATATSLGLAVMGALLARNSVDVTLAGAGAVQVVASLIVVAALRNGHVRAEPLAVRS